MYKLINVVSVGLTNFDDNAAAAEKLKERKGKNRERYLDGACI
jgi:hypothetical protein